MAGKSSRGGDRVGFGASGGGLLCGGSVLGAGGLAGSGAMSGGGALYGRSLAEGAVTI